MLIKIYDEMRRRGLVSSQRDFSVGWCLRAPNFLCENQNLASPASLRNLGYSLLAAGHYDLAEQVVRLLLSPAKMPEWRIGA